MANATTESDAALRRPSDAEVAIYKEICSNIRATDDISFKLIGTVPLVAGFLSGALALWERSSAVGTLLSSGAVAAFSLLGAVMTFALMRWEFRNVQKCNWLIDRAAEFERRMFRTDAGPLGPIQFEGWAESNELLKSIFRGPWGKTQSEKLIYGGAIAAWLVPLAMALSRLY
jgi:hypothetical protein